MLNKAKKHFYHLGPLVIGEIISRLSALALITFVTREYGVKLLGSLALAQAIGTYIISGIDLGTKSIGASLILKNLEFAKELTKIIIKKRSILCAISLVLSIFYVIIGPLPSDDRIFIITFLLGFIPYTFSLDWLVWGLEKFNSLGAWRGLLGFLFSLGSWVLLYFNNGNKIAFSIANFTAYLSSTILLFFLCYNYLKSHHNTSYNEKYSSLLKAIGWKPIFLLGISGILNQMFHNLDVLLLGALSTVTQIGYYTASYKIIFLVTSGFYLITQAIFPKLSKLDDPLYVKKLARIYIGFSAILGTTISLVFIYFSKDILLIIYGPKILPANNIFKILSFALPLEFIVSMAGTALTAMRYYKRILLITGSGAFLNFILNIFLIPKYGAIGSAWATIGSYLLIVMILLPLALGYLNFKTFYKS